MLPRSPRARYRILLLTAALLVAGWLIWSARDALTPFLVAVIAAFALAPIVDWVMSRLPFRDRRPNLAATVAVLSVYAVAVLVLVLIVVLLVPRIGAQVSDLLGNVPALVDQARMQFEHSASWYRERVPPSIQRQINESTQNLAQRAGDIGLQVLRRIFAILTGSVNNLIAYIVVPFWLFYVLKDRKQGAQALYNLFPPSLQDDARVLAAQANRVLGSYIRAQLLLATFSGVITAIGLTLLGVKFSLSLGVVAGIANLIPVVGPIIGGIPILIVAAATQPGWTVLWVFLFLFVVQNLKDYILVPRIQGQAVHLHPAVILVLLVIAGHLAGFWGVLLVVPLAAVVRDVFVYVYRRLGEEPETPVTAEAPETVPAAVEPDRAATTTAVYYPRQTKSGPDTSE